MAPSGVIWYVFAALIMVDADPRHDSRDSKKL